MDRSYDARCAGLTDISGQCAPVRKCPTAGWQGRRLEGDFRLCYRRITHQPGGTDPLNPVWLTFLGDEYTFARRYEDAIGMYERALEIERDYRPAVASLADVHERLERHGDAAAWRLRSLTLRGETDAAAAFAGVSRREGPRAALAWLDRRNLVTLSRGADAHLWDLAYTHARLGNRDTAFAFLHRAYDRREAGLLQARVDPDLDALRGDRRFDDLLQRIGPR